MKESVGHSYWSQNNREVFSGGGLTDALGVAALDVKRSRNRDDNKGNNSDSYHYTDPA